MNDDKIKFILKTAGKTVSFDNFLIDKESRCCICDKFIDKNLNNVTFKPIISYCINNTKEIICRSCYTNNINSKSLYLINENCLIDLRDVSFIMPSNNNDSSLVMKNGLIITDILSKFDITKQELFQRVLESKEIGD